MARPGIEPGSPYIVLTTVTVLLSRYVEESSTPTVARKDIGAMEESENVEEDKGVGSDNYDNERAHWQKEKAAHCEAGHTT